MRNSLEITLHYIIIYKTVLCFSNSTSYGRSFSLDVRFKTDCRTRNTDVETGYSTNDKFFFI